MGYPSVEKLLEDQSVKREFVQSSFGTVLSCGALAEGKMYDETGSQVRPHIENFIQTYNLSMDELLVKDLDEYPVRSIPGTPLIGTSFDSSNPEHRPSTPSSPAVLLLQLDR